MIYQCRLCGGNIATDGKMTVGTCDSCGIMQTVPRLDDERRAQLYERANHFIRQAEYDKATSMFEQILAEDNTDAEAYWSIVLCKYGVEYVDDPRFGKKVPTCNRAQTASVLTDENYLSALKYADEYNKALYQEQAKAIAEVQKRILDISSRETPYDVFICYKEKNAAGERTQDSVIAQELYGELEKVKLRTFFARITLEDKLGQEYEPYIFAALSSARVMVTVGTSASNFNAPWVKNEWSRYLGIMKRQEGRHLIPAYRDIDGYDLPDEFLHLQAVDIGKVGAMQDLVRGIQKLVRKSEITDGVLAQPAASRFLDRGEIYLNNGEWKQAMDYFTRHLDEYPRDYRGWFGLVKAKTQNLTHLECYANDVVSDYINTLQFAPEIEKEEIRQQVDAMLTIEKNALNKKILETDQIIAQQQEIAKKFELEIQNTTRQKQKIEKAKEIWDQEERKAINQRRNMREPSESKALLVITIIVTLYIVIAFVMSTGSKYFQEDMADGGWLPLLIPAVLICACILQNSRRRKYETLGEKSSNFRKNADLENEKINILELEIRKYKTRCDDETSKTRSVMAQKSDYAKKADWYHKAGTNNASGDLRYHPQS